MVTSAANSRVRSASGSVVTPAWTGPGWTMADRWAVVECLRRGMPYREIHRHTGVSVTTIGRVARYLTSGSGGYRAVTERLKLNG